jgi:glycosyltransferase involved in cell wall biosynthesis
MTTHPYFSIIIPVYNRPEEIRELLHSLTAQEYRNFEVLVIEDGSSLACEQEVKAFEKSLQIRYFYKPNTGQGFSRNFGFENARGDFFIIFDSDCIIPPQYLSVVHQAIEEQGLDAYGGPDAAHSSFTPTQKAISYAMTSLFTTGGIRGRKKHAGTFHPRSFNMGLKREVFDHVGGFILTRKGEDIEFSLRMIKAGFKVGLLDQAFVYHKRRTSFSQFWKQLEFFGAARVNINRYHPGEINAVHLFPVLFFLGWVGVLLLSPFVESIRVVGILYLLYFALVLVDASLKNKSLGIGLMSIWAAFIQLSAYGFGFLKELLGFTS